VQLKVPFAMDSFINIMYWSIWIERNVWIFNNEDPLVEKGKTTFKRVFSMVIHRAKNKLVSDMETLAE
jgi:hypothetical protein